MGALKTLALAPGTNVALNALTATVGTLNPMVRYLGPYQTRVQLLELLVDLPLRAPLRGDELRVRPARAVQSAATRRSRTTSATQGATAPADGGVPDTPLGGNEYLHAQAYGAAIDNQGNADCETGQRGYPLKLNHFDPQRRDIGTDPHTPGDQGPTFTGRRARARRARRSAATPRPARSSPTTRATHETRKRRRKRGMSTFTAGLIGIVVIACSRYGAYTKFANPFASQFTVHADVLERQRARARLAGADRRASTSARSRASAPAPGCKRNGPESACQAANVTMAIDNSGLPIHQGRDASRSGRGRSSRATSSSTSAAGHARRRRTAPDGYTFPIQQGIEPVQFDQVLDALQTDTRQNLQMLLQQYGDRGQAGRPRLQRVDPVLAAGLRVLGDRRPRRARDRSRTTCRIGSRRWRPCPARSTPIPRTSRT